MIEVYKATQDDFVTIQKMARIVWPATFNDILTKEQVIYMIDMMYSDDSLLEQVTIKGHVYLLAKEGDTHLGYISFELNYDPFGKTKVHKVYVMPSAQGKGIGKLLINKVADIAIGQNNRKLSLNVNRSNPAIDFYTRLGFIKAGEEKIPIGNGFFMDDFIMEKLLV